MTSTRRVGPALGGLQGTLRMPGDKSIAHRAVLLGAVASGATTVRAFTGGRDNLATVAACRALGVGVEAEGQDLRIAGGGWGGLRGPSATIDCANSGTTMRLLAGLLSGRPFTSRLDGDASLRRRPMRRVAEPLARMGAVVVSEGANGCAPLRIEGRPLHGVTHRLAVASAQVKSALLLAGLQAEGVTTVEEPARSRDHTERLLTDFGVALERSDCRVSLRGPQALRGTVVVLPGDFSSAAFFIVAALLVPGSEMRLVDVGINPTRTGLLDALAAMGAGSAIRCEPSGGGSAEPSATLIVRSARLHGTRVAGELLLRAIDEFPILCIAAACAEGTTELRDAAELRVKESDRIAAMAQVLRALGGRVEELPDGLVIEGPTRFGAAHIQSLGDHRVAMAAAVAGLAGSGAVTIEDADCAEVSFPGFYDALGRVGA